MTDPDAVTDPEAAAAAGTAESESAADADSSGSATEDGSAADPRAVKRVTLRWTGEGMRFLGHGRNGVEIPIDGDSETGPSPMDTLLLGLASCMGSDIVHILEKSRVPLEAMTVEVRGDRAGSHPRRYVRIRLVFRVAGPGPDHRSRLDRALALSRDTYCSVVHSLRSDIDLDFRIERA